MLQVKLQVVSLLMFHSEYLLLSYMYTLDHVMLDLFGVLDPNFKHSIFHPEGVLFCFRLFVYLECFSKYRLVPVFVRYCLICSAFCESLLPNTARLQCTSLSFWCSLLTLTLYPKMYLYLAFILRSSFIWSL